MPRHRTLTLYHATSARHLPSLRRSGVRGSPHEEWGDTVCCLDSLAKARRLAACFGPEGVVLQLRVPAGRVEYHPDYGHGPEFDTIHVAGDLPPAAIERVVPAGHDLPADLIRPPGQPLRQWKDDRDEDFHRRLEAALDTLPEDPAS